MQFFVLLFLLTLISCGGGDSSGTGEPVDLRQTCDSTAGIVGGWEDSSLNTLDLASDCFGSTGDACDYRFTYYKPVSGQVLIDIDSTNGGSCLSNGEHVCSLLYDDTPSQEFIRLNCGEGDIIYLPR